VTESSVHFIMFPGIWTMLVTDAFNFSFLHGTLYYIWSWKNTIILKQWNTSKYSMLYKKKCY